MSTSTHAAHRCTAEMRGRIAAALVLGGTPSQVAKNLGVPLKECQRVSKREDAKKSRKREAAKYKRAPLYRCPTCGGWVYLKPCVLCQVTGGVS